MQAPEFRGESAIERDRRCAREHRRFLKGRHFLPQIEEENAALAELGRRAAPPGPRQRPVSAFPAMRRDLSFHVFLAFATGASLLAPVAPLHAQDVIPPLVVEPETRTVPLEAEDMENARGLGSGMGMRASGAGTSALLYNASALPRKSFYQGEILTGTMAQEGRWTVGAALVDSMTSYLKAGLLARGIIDRGGGLEDYSGFDGRLALAVPIGDVVGIGVSGRFMSLHGSASNDEERDEALQLRTGNVDASVRVSPTPWLHIAALAYDLIDTGSSLAPRRVGGSLSFTPLSEQLSVGVDGLADIGSFDHATALLGVGGQYDIIELIPVRLGYRFDSGRRLHSVTAGVGVDNGKFNVEASVRQDVSAGYDTRVVLAIGYRSGD